MVEQNWHPKPKMQLSDLVGRTVVNVEGLSVGSDRIRLTTSDGFRWTLYHDQDCCEHVSVDDVEGSAADLMGLVTMAEESTGDGPVDGYDSTTWTFYRFAAAGYVTVRWLGESNGYYSEGVDVRVEGIQA